MYFPGIELDSFDSLPIAARVIVLRRLLETLAQANVEYLLRHPKTPALYEWAPAYEIKPRPYVPATGEQTDIWQDIPSTMRRGTGDCKDVAAWRVAELYLAGYKVGFHVKVGQIGDLVVYHIQVEGYNRDGRFVREDPSKLLGMPRPDNVTPQQISAILTG